MNMHLKKLITEYKIKNNPKNRTANCLSNMKKKKNDLMHTTIPLTKKIKIKRKEEHNMEIKEMLHINYISFQKQQVIQQTQITLRILVSIMFLMMTWRILIIKPLHFYKTPHFHTKLLKFFLD